MMLFSTTVSSIARWCILAIAIGCLTITNAHSASDEKDSDIVTLVQIISGSSSESNRAIRKLDRSWDDVFVLPLIEILRLNADGRVEQKIIDYSETSTKISRNSNRCHFCNDLEIGLIKQSKENKTEF